jgi:hypothetical protein
MQLFLDEERTESTGIYWLLWIQWQMQQGLPDGPSFWDEDTERVMGISGPELLLKITGLTLKYSPDGLKRLRRNRTFDGRDSETIQCALEGIEVLAAMSDQMLAESFLSQLVSPCQ